MQCLWMKEFPEEEEEEDKKSKLNEKNIENLWIETILR